MLKRLVVISAVVLFSFAILFISVLRTASVKYSFSLINPESKVTTSDTKEKLEELKIDYYLAYPGPIMPDHPLWRLKALRDKLWLLITSDKYKKAELNLLFSDKRLTAAKILFEKGNYELGFTTLSKAEIYLQKACELEDEIRTSGSDTLNLTATLIKASFKHRQIIEQILLIAPEDAKANIVLVENYSRGVYGRKIHVLQSRGITPITDPFCGL